MARFERFFADKPGTINAANQTVKVALKMNGSTANENLPLYSMFTNLPLYSMFTNLPLYSMFTNLPPI